LNHFAAHHFTARHMNWLHAAYSLGAAMGPVIMTALLAQERSWRTGYVTVAVGLASLATLFVLTSGRWTADPLNPVPDTSQSTASLRSVLRAPLVWLQMLAFFVYTGLELTIGQWTFTVLTELRHVPEGRAGTLVAGYWVSILAGRVLFGFVVDRLGIDRLLRLSIGAATAGAALLTAGPGQPLAALGLALCGLGLAPVFPCLMTRTPQRLGSAVSVHAIGMQVSAAMVGAAVLPSLAGVLAQWRGLEAVPAAALAMSLILLGLHELLLHRGAEAQPRGNCI
jgi:fucose permease